MNLVGIDIGKNSHFVNIMDKLTGEIILNPISFKNNIEGFISLIKHLNTFSKDDILIGMKDTGHYHFALLQYLLTKEFRVALINPKTTDLNHRLNGRIIKNDKLDTLNICGLLSSNKQDKPYRITLIGKFDLYEQKQLTRQHHVPKEEINVLSNRL